MTGGNLGVRSATILPCYISKAKGMHTHVVELVEEVVLAQALVGACVLQAERRHVRSWHLLQGGERNSRPAGPGRGVTWGRP